ncbi:hypothetical protein TWF694_009835 [Orbilia ellipsospora]|uniref:Transcriptional coactivator p15 (PC4) C-terminal domain-containing protein n=1 Tax=Orbilia ellipsospora TaxID=2528407 RepID=A0AAV9XIF3_9PEZI
MPPKRQFAGKFSKKPFTKRTYNNDNDGDDSSPKRFKQSTASSSSSSKPPDGARHVDDEGNFYWELSGKGRRVTVSEFNGNLLVSVREYYEKDGKTLPGKKGISLSLDQFNQLIRVLPALEEAISQKSSAGVVRPIYTTSAKHDAPKDPKAEEKTEEEEEDEVKNKEEDNEEKTSKKSTIQKSKQPKSKAVIDSEDDKDEEEEQVEDSEEE